MTKGLEDLKWLVECEYIELHGWQEDVEMLDCVNNIEKELKALEIIREKRVDCFKLIAIMRTSNNLEHYNQNYGEQFQLKQEECDLLKEVLL